MRVLLADDHALVRAGIRALLVGLPDVESVVEAGDGQEALTVLRETKPDLALIDIAMPGLNGLELAARVSREAPGTRLVILSMHGTPAHVAQALRAGVSGYLLKDAAADELPVLLRAVMRGETYLSPAISKQVVDGYLGRTAPSAAAPGEGPAPDVLDVAPARDPAARGRGEVDEGGRAAPRRQRQDGRDPPRPDHGAAGHSRSGRAWSATRSAPAWCRPTASALASTGSAPRERPLRDRSADPPVLPLWARRGPAREAAAMETERKRRVLLVDDSPAFRGLLQWYLGTLPEVEIVAEAANGEQAIEEVTRAAARRRADGRPDAEDGRPRGHAPDSRAAANRRGFCCSTNHATAIPAGLVAEAGADALLDKAELADRLPAEIANTTNQARATGRHD